MSIPRKPSSPRVAAVDAYRGFVMFLMMAEVLHLSQVAAALPDNPLWENAAASVSRIGIELPGKSFWQFLAHHQTHAEWHGCSLHDLIQPSFSFLVGVAVPFSIASRMARGQTRGLMVAHAAWRALVLVLLGVFLRSVSKKQTYWTFEDTLSQIGLGYVPLFLLGLWTVGLWEKARKSGGEIVSEENGPSSLADSVPGDDWRWLVWCSCALGVVLVGYWAAFALYPLPGPDFDWRAVGVPADWPYHYSGFAAHWDKNSNLAWAFDRWFLNLFPREKTFTHNGGGYATLSFIPTLGTMILGLIAGERLRRSAMRQASSPAPTEPSESVSHGQTMGELTSGYPSNVTARNTIAWFTAAGLVCLASGYLLDRFGICPSVKRIWTPAWTLFSGGWCFLLLALFYLFSDALDLRAWSFPLRVIGANSIAAYCIAHLWGGFIITSFKTHLGPNIFAGLGSAYERLLQGIAVLTVYWLILFWMYWRGIFLRI